MDTIFKVGYDRFMNNATLVNFGNSALTKYVLALDWLDLKNEAGKCTLKASDRARALLRPFMSAGLLNEVDAAAKAHGVYMAHNVVVAQVRAERK